MHLKVSDPARRTGRVASGLNAMTTYLSSPNAAVKRMPGGSDFWVFIAAESLLFGFFFITYIFYRSGSIELYNLSQQALNRGMGAFNTAVLIVSSWSVVQALEAVRRDRLRVAPRYLSFSIVLALVFLTVKICEYHDKFHHGINLTTNDFFMFYFVLTMIHMVHVIVGTVVLIVLRQGIVQGKYHRDNMNSLEMGASYWHLVDLLWIFLFPLLYLLR
jgi:nitric oxide reductase NorE protein